MKIKKILLPILIIISHSLCAQSKFDLFKIQYDSLASIGDRFGSLIITQKMNQWAFENEGDTSLNYAVSFRYIGNCYENTDSALYYYNLSKYNLEKQGRVKVVEYGDCLNNIGLIYAAENDTANAINNYQSALLIYDNSIGRNNFNYLKTLSNIALLYFNIQNYNQAERYYKIIEQIFVNNRLENSEKNIVNNIKLGDVYFNLLNYKESAKYLFKATEYLEKVYPKYENDYYLVLRKIGQLFQAQNDYNNAEFYYEKSYQICKNRSVSKEIDNGWCLYYLAYCYQLNNNYLASENCFLKSYSILNKDGISIPVKLAFLYDIANFYFVSGDTIKTFNYLATADSIYIVDNNVYSSDYADCQFRKGCYYVFVNKIDSAELLFDNSIAIRKIILKNNFDEVNVSIKQIGELYLKYNRVDLSEKYFNQIKKTVLRYNDSSSLFYVRSMNDIGLQYYRKEYYQLAEFYFLECYKTLEDEIITEKNDIIIITNNLALLYLNKGDYNNAKEYFIKYYNLLHNSKDQDITKKVECLINLGLVYYKLNDYNLARNSYKSAIDNSLVNRAINKELFKKLVNNYCILLSDYNHFKIQLLDLNYLLKICESLKKEDLLTRIYFELGGLYMDNRSYEVAEKYYKAGLNLNKFKNEVESIDVVYSNIGLLYYKKKEWNKSLHYYNIAIEKINELYGKASIKYAKALVDIGNVYYKTSQYRNTDSLYTEAIEFEKVFYGLNDTNRLGLLDKSANFYYVTNYNNKKGLDYYKEYLDLSSRKFCNSDSLLIEVWYNMAELYSDEKDTINAFNFYQKATKAQEVLSGELSYEVGRLLYATGFMFFSNQSSQNAKHYFYLAKKILEKDNTTQSSIDNLYYNLGLIYQNEEILDSSIYYYSKVLRTKDTKLKASVYNNLGLVYYRILNNKEALKWFDKSIQIAEQLSSYDLMANPLLNKTIVYQNQNDSLKYFSTMTDLLYILNKLGNYSAIAVAYMNIGRYYFNLGVSDSAYMYYLISDSLYRIHSIPTNDNYALLLNNLSIYYQSKNNIDSAIYFNQKSLNAFKSINLINYNYVIALNQTAILYESSGYIKKADEYYNTAIEINERLFHKITNEYLITYNNYGKYLISNNNYYEAKSIYLYIKKVIEEKNFESGVLYPTALSNLGTCYVMQKMNDSALFYFRLAEENIFKHNQFELLPWVYNGFILAGMFSTDTILVEKYFKLADSAITKQIDKQAIYALLLSNYSSYLIDNNKLQKAKHYLDIADSLRIKSDLNYQHINFLYAWYYFKSKEYSELIRVYNDWFKQKSENIFNRFTTLSYREKRVFWNKEIGEFLSIFNLMQYEDYKEIAIPTFNSSLFIKSFLVDDNNTLNNSINTNNDTLINSTKRSKAMFLAQLGKTLNTETNKLIIKNLKSDIDSCDKILIQNSTDFQKLNQRINIRWNDIKYCLKDNESAIEFSKYYDAKDSSFKYMAQVLRSNYEYPYIVKLCSENEVEKHKAGNGLSDLYHLVWEPIDSLLEGVKTVYYSPDGLLYSVPFHALCMNDSAGCNYLMDKYTLHQLNTTRYLADSTLINTKPLNNTIALYGGINYETVNDTINTNQEETNENYLFANTLKRETIFKAVDYLPGTKQEVESVFPLLNKNKWTTTVTTGAKATEQLFKSKSDSLAPSIIHIATHGFAFPDKEEKQKKNNMNMLLLNNTQMQYTAADDPMMRCGLMFAGANKSWTGKQKEMIEQTGQDGILTAAEVANMDLSNTKLVVLSACETGLGKVEGSEGVFGLQRGFKLAGVEQLIVSLWKVPDHETMELMNLFYTDLTITKDPVISFSKAQKQMRNNYPDNPEKWAGFVLVR